MYKVVYKRGSFTNYEGRIVDFILAAVSIPEDGLIIPEDELGLSCFERESDFEYTKILSLGIAICRPEDTWNEEVGKTIAYNKAVGRRNHCIVTSDSGIINTKVVEAIVTQEAEYLQTNPGKYIAGYDEARKKYKAAKAKEEYLNSLTDQEKQALNTLVSIKDPEKFLEAVEDERKKLATNTTNTNSSN